MLLKFEGGEHDGREMDVPDGVTEQIVPHPAGRLGKTGGDRYRRQSRKGKPDVMVFAEELSRDQMGGW